MTNTLNEILIKVPREEHRDREWVDKNGIHWAWCEDTWMVLVPTYIGGGMATGCYEWQRPGRGEKPVTQPPEGAGPFMDGLYHRLTRGR